VRTVTTHWRQPVTPLTFGRLPPVVLAALDRRVMRPLRANDVAARDLDHLGEEIESAGKRDPRTMHSHLKVPLLHWLTRTAQPSRRWPRCQRRGHSARDTLRLVCPPRLHLRRAAPRPPADARPRRQPGGPRQEPGVMGDDEPEASQALVHGAVPRHKTGRHALSMNPLRPAGPSRERRTYAVR
jgi:hypothetical protein